MNQEVSDNFQQKQFKQYPYRIVIIIIYIFISMVNGMCSVIVTPISVPIQQTYQISASWVTFIPMSFLLFYILFNFPSNWIIDVKGIKKGVFIGALLTCIGCLVRCLVNTSFAYMIIGQVFCAIGQPFLFNSSMKIATRWFIPKNRPLAMTILNITMIGGSAVGFFIPPMFVSDQNTKQEIKQNFQKLQLFEGGLASLSTLLILVLFQQSPPTLPSVSLMTKNTQFKKSFGVMIRNKKFLSLTFAFGSINGVFNVYGSLTDNILDPFGFSTNDISIIGTALLIFGLVFAPICGIYIQRTLKYRNIFWFCSFIALFTSIALPLSLKTLSSSQYYWLFFFLVSIQGIVFISLQPITIDYGIDIMFPVGQAQITGLMLTIGQIIGIIFVEVAQQIFGLGDPQNNEEKQRSAAFNSVLFCNIFLILGSINLIFQNSELKRTKIEQRKKQISSQNTLKSENNDDLKNNEKQSLIQTQSQK